MLSLPTFCRQTFGEGQVNAGKEGEALLAWCAQTSYNQAREVKASESP